MKAKEVEVLALSLCSRLGALKSVPKSRASSSFNSHLCDRCRNIQNATVSASSMLLQQSHAYYRTAIFLERNHGTSTTKTTSTRSSAMKLRLLPARRPKSSACKRLMLNAAYNFFEESRRLKRQKCCQPSSRRPGITIFHPRRSASGGNWLVKMIPIETCDLPRKIKLPVCPRRIFN